MTKDKRTALNGVELQHRHFAFIAGVIAKIEEQAERRRTAKLFANELSSTSRNFDDTRFFAACEI